jgi:hypothetical protein
MSKFLSALRDPIRSHFDLGSAIATIIPEEGIRNLCTYLPATVEGVRSLGMVHPGVEEVVLNFMIKYVKSFITRAVFPVQREKVIDAMDIDSK